MSNLVFSTVFAVSAVCVASWAQNSSAGFWYATMSIVLLAIAFLYAAQGILELVDELHYSRKIHKPQRNTIKSSKRKAG